MFAFFPQKVLIPFKPVALAYRFHFENLFDSFTVRKTPLNLFILPNNRQEVVIKRGKKGRKFKLQFRPEINDKR